MKKKSSLKSLLDKPLTKKEHKRLYELSLEYQRYIDPNPGKFLEFIEQREPKLYKKVKKLLAKDIILPIIENIGLKIMTENDIKSIEDRVKKYCELTEKVKKFKGGHLTENTVELYTRVFQKHDNEIVKGKNPSWSEVFIWTAKSKDKKGNPLISDMDDIKRRLKAFLNFRKRHNLNSLQDFNNYLKEKSYSLT